MLISCTLIQYLLSEIDVTNIQYKFILVIILIHQSDLQYVYFVYNIKIVCVSWVHTVL